MFKKHEIFIKDTIDFIAEEYEKKYTSESNDNSEKFCNSNSDSEMTSHLTEKEMVKHFLRSKK